MIPITRLKNSVGEGAGVPHLELLERLLVQVQHVKERGFVRAAACHHVGGGEHLERPDDSHHKVEEQRRRGRWRAPSGTARTPSGAGTTRKRAWIRSGRRLSSRRRR